MGEITCRGWIINYASHRKKVKNHQVESLTLLLTELENKHKESPKNDKVNQELVKVKSELNSLSHQKKFMLYQLKSKNYEMGERAGKVLAQKLQKVKTRLIQAVKADQTMIIDTKGRFKTFYEVLYGKEVNVTEHDLDTFFKKAKCHKWKRKK